MQSEGYSGCNVLEPETLICPVPHLTFTIVHIYHTQRDGVNRVRPSSPLGKPYAQGRTRLQVQSPLPGVCM